MRGPGGRHTRCLPRGGAAGAYASDQLHTLPNIICSAVRLGARRAAATALVSVQLHTGMYLEGLDHGFPATSSAAVRRASMLNSTGFVRVIVAEMDVDDLL